MSDARKRVEQAIACSNNCRKAVELVRDHAFAQFRAGQIAVAEYNRVDEECMKALGEAARMVNRAAAGLGADLDANLAAIERATAELKDASATLEKAQNVIALSASLLVAVASVAVAVIDPTKASAGAAVSAVGSAMGSIAKAAAD
ncbi:MAG: hypothetical protein EXR72_04770 [Myxococcales bacterium]|nr:hypothetical protein [Myxococcales bacterium]